MRYATEEANTCVFLLVSLLVTLSGTTRTKISVKNKKLSPPTPTPVLSSLSDSFFVSYLNMEKQSSEYTIKEGTERRLIKCVSSFAFMASIMEGPGKATVHTSVIFSLDIK